MNEALSNDLGMQPAHPIADLNKHPGPYGLTKRELFAAMAMQGFATDPEMGAWRSEEERIRVQSDTARTAVQWADALLSALEQNRG